MVGALALPTSLLPPLLIATMTIGLLVEFGMRRVVSPVGRLEPRAGA